jgi:hypothetical protein
MPTTKTNGLHLPNMSTMLMVEKTIKESDKSLKKMLLYKAILKSMMMYQTFEKVLEYLESHNQRTYDQDGRIVWIAADNPKLRKLLKSGGKSSPWDTRLLLSMKYEALVFS